MLIHCAYDFSVTSRSDVWDANVFGTRSLLDLAVSSGVRRTIFVSSMSAYPGTRQVYGRVKLASETDAFARGMCAIRPGLIYGPGWGAWRASSENLRRFRSFPWLGAMLTNSPFTRMTSDTPSQLSFRLERYRVVPSVSRTQRRFDLRNSCAPSPGPVQAVTPDSFPYRGRQCIGPFGAPNARH